ncbi:MAG: isoleucine--tRNA ligase [Devosia sp.]|nr:isoleucine--tRNA ligase [Devosia sp.]
MNDSALGEKTETDYSGTLFLPQTDFPMRAGLPEREPIWLKRWEELDIFSRQRQQAADRPKFTLHDGPPYANGNIHIGHALNKTLKDLVSRAAQMQGYNSAYVPGWDCHGLPIEWKIEEEYRAKGKDKDDVDIIEFRAECRAFAQHWIDVQREEFKRLGIIGDWNNPYLTMSFDAEAQIARELMKVANSGQLYRGSKPVMWSVVERTALAEAEIEYADYESDTIWVKFPIHSAGGEITSNAFHDLNASVVIWTTTPWTIPANRAISYSSKIAYGLYEVTKAPQGNWASVGEKYVLADKLAAEVFAKAKVEAYARIGDVDPAHITSCLHPLHGLGGGYDFEVPLLDGEHVTDDTGTGFVHTAPGHGLDDFEIWLKSGRMLAERGIDTAIPFMVDDAGFYTSAAPGFEGARVLDDNGKKGDANNRVIAALTERGMMVARGRVKHQYPHSWRSKKPVIFRNTPQWFVYMDRDIEGTPGDTLRNRALAAIDATKFYPPAGQNRLRSMIAERPDWVLSRQRAWGVPIAVFVNRDTGQILKDEQVNHRITQAFEEEGADAWFKPGAAARFLGDAHDPGVWEKVDDILDVWFESGTTHSWVLKNRQKWPWLTFPASMYLEGSDQHRGWFHSSLLESCATNGYAPYASVLTHGFTLDAEGKKMSKSLGNTVAPQDIIKQYGADILRLWVASADYAEDLRIGKEIIQTTVDAYRKIRNTLRWLLGNLAHYDAELQTPVSAMADLDRLVLHRLKVLEKTARAAYAAYDYKRVVAAISNFSVNDLSAFYFDIRKDALYCDPISSGKRRGALTTISFVFDALVKWLAPILPFTAEESWLSRHPEAVSVHLELFPELPESWLDEALEARWEKIVRVRRVVTGALEIERRDKRIGSSLEAAPKVYISDGDLLDALQGEDFAEICITSSIEVIAGNGPDDAFRLAEVTGVAVVPGLAEGKRCARSWKILPEVGSDPDYPDLSPRDAEAMRERKAAGLAA